MKRVPGEQEQRNVVGGLLKTCSMSPVTGYFRDGCCSAGPGDRGQHWVCARVTAEFLAFSKARGNDLSTPRPEFGFPGLRPGDQWCLCALRFVEAYEADAAPKVDLEATHENTLKVISLEKLLEHQIEDDVALQ